MKNLTKQNSTIIILTLLNFGKGGKNDIGTIPQKKSPEVQWTKRKDKLLTIFNLEKMAEETGITQDKLFFITREIPKGITNPYFQKSNKENTDYSTLKKGESLSKQDLLEMHNTIKIGKEEGTPLEKQILRLLREYYRIK